MFSCLIPKRIICQFYYSKIDPRLRYIGVKDFSTELNCKKSSNLIQYLEDDILIYSSTVLFCVRFLTASIKPSTDTANQGVQTFTQKSSSLFKLKLERIALHI